MRILHLFRTTSPFLWANLAMALAILPYSVTRHLDAGAVVLSWHTQTWLMQTILFYRVQFRSAGFAFRI
jgi:hypothetical protein